MDVATVLTFMCICWSFQSALGITEPVIIGKRFLKVGIFKQFFLCRTESENTRKNEHTALTHALPVLAVILVSHDTKLNGEIVYAMTLLSVENMYNQ